jgi:hypothetical protein
MSDQPTEIWPYLPLLGARVVTVKALICVGKQLKVSKHRANIALEPSTGMAFFASVFVLWEPGA